MQNLGDRPLAGGLTPEKLAKYTFFFDPTLGQAFDQSDWQTWLRPPAGTAVQLINTAGFREAGDPTNWWGYNEIPCDKRSAFNQTIDTGTAYTYAHDLGRVQADNHGNDFYLGTEPQFSAIQVGRDGIIPDGACAAASGTSSRGSRAW